jgi:hypothetical protein
MFVGPSMWILGGKPASLFICPFTLIRIRIRTSIRAAIWIYSESGLLKDRQVLSKPYIERLILPIADLLAGAGGASTLVTACPGKYVTDHRYLYA